VKKLYAAVVRGRAALGLGDVEASSSADGFGRAARYLD